MKRARENFENLKKSEIPDEFFADSEDDVPLEACTTTTATTTTTVPPDNIYWERKYKEYMATPDLVSGTPLRFSKSGDMKSASPTVGVARVAGCACTDYFAWCKSHGFFKPLCPTHKATNLKEEQGRWVCICLSLLV